VDGVPLRGGALPTLRTAPGQSEELRVPAGGLPAAGECLLTLSFRLADATDWAPAGHEVAFAQFALPAPARTRAPVVLPARQGVLEGEEVPEGLVLSGPSFRLSFGASQGALASWRLGGHELLREGPRLDVWRAPTDNDATTWGDEQAARQWRAAGLDRLEHNVASLTAERLGPAVIRVCVAARAAAPDLECGLAIGYTYDVCASGDVRVRVQVQPFGELPHLPRLGLRLALPATFDQAIWYGRGPFETYPDRKTGARVGLYQSSVDALYYPYIRPQENGNRTDVRWVALTNSSAGVGLLAEGLPALNFAALRYDAADLERARHTHELRPRDAIIVHLDWRQSGLGGASCGPGRLPQYCVWPEPSAFSLRLRAFEGDTDAVTRLVAQPAF
ncbi:MAG: DUF4981 domain-containing protein, partial [Chloroflexi bacterium]|nr:DUF4981 domain-containing protein [Chloroflexota bacterium]